MIIMITIQSENKIDQIVKPKRLSFNTIPNYICPSTSIFDYNSPSFDFNFLNSISINKKNSVFDFALDFEDSKPIARKETAPQSPERMEIEPIAKESFKIDTSVKRSSSSENHKKIRKLKKVCKLMADIINCDKLQVERLDLDDIELKLIKTILSRKFNDEKVNTVLNEINDLNDTGLLYKLSATINTLNLEKRKDEIIKFFYKQTLKQLKKRMNVPYKGNDPSKELFFWEHYFKQTSDEKMIPLNEFYDPLNNRRIKNPSYKNLKNGYLALVFNNELFRKDFMNYVDNTLKFVYQRKVFSKFKKMMKPIRSKVKKAKDGSYSVSVSKFLVKIEQSKNFKFPWTNKEIDEGISLFKEHIRHILKKNQLN